MPPMLPAPSSVTLGARPAASVNDSSMSAIAMVRLAGVGSAKSEAYTLPVTCGELENTLVASAVNEKPVMKVAAAGLTPTFPVTAEVGTVEIALFARMAYPPAMPRLSGTPGATLLPPSVLLPPSAAVPDVESPQAAGNDSRSNRAAPVFRRRD